MASSGYEVARYEPRHREALLAIQALHWGADREANERLFSWKYEQNPWAPTPLVYLVWHEGELVGMRGFHGSRWEAGRPTQAFDLHGSGDLVIAPSHRDHGVFTALMRSVLSDIAGDGAPFLINLSAGPSTRLGSLSLGWRQLGPLDRVKWEHSRRPRDHVDQFAVLDARLAKGDARLGQHIVVSDAPRPATMAELVRRRGHDGRIRHVRDEAWFQWRFGHPNVRFRFLYLTSGDDRIDGYLVLQNRAATVSSPVQIFDCEADAAGAGALLDAAVRECGLWRIMSWRATIELAGEAVIRRCGFVDLQVKSVTEDYPTVLILPNAISPVPEPWNLGGRQVLDPANWDLRQAFSDGR